MAVSARLSRTLHQRLGDEAGEDLVNWMGQVEQNRSELREVFDLSMARIDSRFAEQMARIDSRFAEHLAHVDSRFERIDARFVEQQIRMDSGFASLESRLEVKMERRFADLLKWSFVFWCGAVAAVAALAGVLK